MKQKAYRQKNLHGSCRHLFCRMELRASGGEKRRRGSVKEAGVGTQRLGLRQHTIHFLEGQALLVAVLRSAAWEIFSVILIGPPSFLL